MNAPVGGVRLFFLGAEKTRIRMGPHAGVRPPCLVELGSFFFIAEKDIMEALVLLI